MLTFTSTDPSTVGYRLAIAARCNSSSRASFLASAFDRALESNSAAKALQSTPAATAARTYHRHRESLSFPRVRDRIAHRMLTNGTALPSNLKIADTVATRSYLATKK